MDTMDTSRSAGAVEAAIATIKRAMPLTYADITRKASPESLGKEAYALVRRGLRGEANCFYAIESGHVMGTPFAKSDVTDQVAGLMVQFGFGFAIFWPHVEGAGHGAN
jgi:hypothetical protein